MQRTLFAIALSLSMALLSGCGGGQGRYLQKGIDRYDQADYGGAMGELQAVNAGALNQKATARYLVYRGLTEYHLSQRQDARADLTRGKEVLARGSASWIPPQITEEMDNALADLSAPHHAKLPASSEPSAPPVESAAPVAPTATTTGQALVPIKTAAPVKTAAASPPPPPVKTSAPPTKTLSSSQSTSPK